MKLLLNIIVFVVFIALAITGCGEKTLQETKVSASGFTTEDWQSYQAVFITQEGRVVDTGNQDISHSEGQGYAMLLAWAARDLATFEQLWQWTQQHLQRDDGLFGWQWLPDTLQERDRDWNNATDGDLLIAWALAEAGHYWEREDWLQTARHIAERLRATLIRDSSMGPMLIPAQTGFEFEEYMVLNPSYWVFPAFPALHAIDPDPVWGDLTQSGLRLLNRVRYGPDGVPPDWVAMHAEGFLSLGSLDAKQRRFGFEALRVPLYICWAELSSPHLMQAFVQAWPDDQAPAWLDLVTQDRAAYALTLSQRAMRPLLTECGRTMPFTVDLDPDDYYGSTLSLLAAWVRQQRKQP